MIILILCNRKSVCFKMIRLNETKLENWLSFYTQFSLIKQNWCASTNRSCLRVLCDRISSISYYPTYEWMWLHAAITFGFSTLSLIPLNEWGSFNNTKNRVRKTYWTMREELKLVYDGWLRTEKKEKYENYYQEENRREIFCMTLLVYGSREFLRRIRLNNFCSNTGWWILEIHWLNFHTHTRLDVEMYF